MPPDGPGAQFYGGVVLGVAGLMVVGWVLRVAVKMRKGVGRGRFGRVGREEVGRWA